jgi:hypothetical protein
MKKSLQLGYEDILLEITQQQDKLRRSTPVVELPISSSTTTPLRQALVEAQLPHRNTRLMEPVARSSLADTTTPAAPAGTSLTPEEQQEELQGTLRPLRTSASG